MEVFDDKPEKENLELLLAMAMVEMEEA